MLPNVHRWVCGRELVLIEATALHLSFACRYQALLEPIIFPYPCKLPLTSIINILLSLCFFAVVFHDSNSRSRPKFTFSIPTQKSACPCWGNHTTIQTNVSATPWSLNPVCCAAPLVSPFLDFPPQVPTQHLVLQDGACIRHGAVGGMGGQNLVKA